MMQATPDEAANAEQQRQTAIPELELRKLEMADAHFRAELEHKKAELELKQRELALRERELQPKRWWFTGPAATVAAGLVALAGTLGAGLNQWHANVELEREKLRSGLVLEVMKTGKPSVARTNLKFVLETGLLKDPDGAIRDALESGEELLVLPVEGTGTTDAWESQAVGLQRFTKWRKSASHEEDSDYKRAEELLRLWIREVPEAAGEANWALGRMYALRMRAADLSEARRMLLVEQAMGNLRAAYQEAAVGGSDEFYNRVLLGIASGNPMTEHDLDALRKVPAFMALEKIVRKDHDIDGLIDEKPWTHKY